MGNGIARRLMALLMALALLGGAALAEEDAPMESAMEEDAPMESAMEEPAVPELGEVALPLDDDAPPTDDGGDGEDIVFLTEAGEGADDVAIDADVPAADADAALDPDAEVLAPDADAANGASDQPILATTSLTLGVREKVTLTLANGASPQSVGATFTSSKPKVASVSAAGVVTAGKKGTATITLRVGDVQSTCTVTVRKAPKKIKLSAKKLTLGLDEKRALSFTLTKGSASAVKMTSGNPSVATVQNGVITATGVGTTRITARTFNGKKATCKVTVKLPPASLSANVGALTLWKGRTFKIEPILSSGSAGAVTCATSDSRVVTVSGTTLRAVGKGQATVTLTTYNGLSAQIAVTVTKTPTYRALLIGECTFPGAGVPNLPGKNDVALMKKMLRSVKGPARTGWKVHTRCDVTSAQIHNAIKSAFSGAQEGDVSLFYISTHGDDVIDYTGNRTSYAGALYTHFDPGHDNWFDGNMLTLGTLADWLNEVPGQVVVIIDSCGSGAAIYGARGVSASAQGSSDGDGANVTEVHAFSPEAFDAAVVDAFRSVDAGVLAPGQGVFVLENKFYVLTASAYKEAAWSAGNRYSYFAKWLTDSIKTKGRMPADANRNRVTTLNELYRCVSKKANRKVFNYKGYSYRQHVQVYPAKSGFELFYR